MRGTIEAGSHTPGADLTSHYLWQITAGARCRRPGYRRQRWIEQGVFSLAVCHVRAVRPRASPARRGPRGAARPTSPALDHAGPLKSPQPRCRWV